MSLVKALLVDHDRKTQLEVKFNPKEFSVERQVQWSPREGSDTDDPEQQFTKPTPSTLSVTLHFDTYEDRESVKIKYTDKLEQLVSIVSKEEKDKRRPPRCSFIWGKFGIFTGVVESLSLKYTMFLSDGTPVRCEATLKMKKAGKQEDNPDKYYSGSK